MLILCKVGIELKNPNIFYQDNKTSQLDNIFINVLYKLFFRKNNLCRYLIFTVAFGDLLSEPLLTELSRSLTTLISCWHEAKNRTRTNKNDKARCKTGFGFI